MSSFPAEIGDRRFEDAPALAAFLEEMAGASPSPGQPTPLDELRAHIKAAHPSISERIEAGKQGQTQLRANPVERALWEAGAHVLRTSQDVAALRLAVALGGSCWSPAFFGAVLDRLEGQGPPLPPGRSGDRLRRLLVGLAASWFPASEPDLRVRSRALLESEGEWMALTSMLAVEDPEGDLPEVFKKAVESGPVGVVHLRRLLAAVVRGYPDRVLETARQLRTQPDFQRQVALQVIQAEMPAEWIDEHESALKDALGVGG